MKKRSKKGFTLIEMLIVIAIIAILAAIAFPTFSAQLTKANEAVDEANLRAATSLAYSDYMLNDLTGDQYYSAVSVGDSSMEITTPSSEEIATAPASAVAGKVTDHNYMEILISDGVVESAVWK
ncbi:MAG: prepilin-type N-terminal cleavage/methylation domain-containing protein [Eubacteriales bacterium]|nr:prepilin-type N-terminal cleavage/methylation domain-containing protein [Eubacteriales bacterium]